MSTASELCYLWSSASNSSSRRKLHLKTTIASAPSIKLLPKKCSSFELQQQTSTILFRSVHAPALSAEQPTNKLFTQIDATTGPEIDYFYEYERSSTLCLTAHFFYDCACLSLSTKLPWPTQACLRNARFSIRLKLHNRSNSK